MCKYCDPNIMKELSEEHMLDTEFGRLRVKDMFYLKEDYLLNESPKVYVKISDTEAVKIMFMPVIKAINKDTKVIPVYDNGEGDKK